MRMHHQPVVVAESHTLEHLLASRHYREFVRQLGASERISATVPEGDIPVVAQMFQTLHAQLGQRWREPSPELEVRMLDYLVELDVLRPAYP